MATHSSILAGEIPWTEQSLAGYSPWGRKELEMTEHTHTHTQNCSLLSMERLFPEPPRTPKSTDAQVPCIKWCSLKWYSLKWCSKTYAHPFL